MMEHRSDRPSWHPDDCDGLCCWRPFLSRRGGPLASALARPASPATEPPTVGRGEADDFRDDCLRLAQLLEDEGHNKAAAPVLNDLRDRLMRAQIALIEMAAINHRSGSRLSGKAQGVSLAISYVDEYLRGAHVLGEDD